MKLVAIFDIDGYLSKYVNTEIYKATTLNPEIITQDYSKSLEFISLYKGTYTFVSYKSILEKFLIWVWINKQKGIKEIKRNDIEEFINYSLNPPKDVIGHKSVRKFITVNGTRVTNPQWRPYIIRTPKYIKEGKVSRYMPQYVTTQLLNAALNSYYRYLVCEEYITVNPVEQIRQKTRYIRRPVTIRKIRRLSTTQLTYVINTTRSLADKYPRHERSLFIISALYGMYLRISELLETERWSPQMGHFFRDQYGNWWFKTVGKGNKERDISVSNSMLEALKRYRRHLGLSSTPMPGETTPLIAKIKGHGNIRSKSQLWSEIQSIFNITSVKLKEDGLLDEAEQLQHVTTHWLRHTGISDDVQTRPREHVRDDAGHSSGAITDRYIDVELIKRHESARNKVI